MSDECMSTFNLLFIKEITCCSSVYNSSYGAFSPSMHSFFGVCFTCPRLIFFLVAFYVLFLRRAHSSDYPPLFSNPLPTDYETRALTNAPPGTLRPLMTMSSCLLCCSNPLHGFQVFLFLHLFARLLIAILLLVLEFVGFLASVDTNRPTYHS